RSNCMERTTRNGPTSPNTPEVDPSLFRQAPPPPPPPAPPSPPEGADPFDPDRLRLAQDFSASLGVKEVLTTIPVRRPAKEWFFRVHAAPEYRLQTVVIELKEAREVYLVAPTLWPGLAGESTLKATVLYTAITRQGVLFFWPISLPNSGGRAN